jgi:Tfp pilus assembly protein PilO
MEERARDLERRMRTVQQEGQSNADFLTAVRELEEYAQGFPDRADLVELMTRLTRLARSLALNVPDVDYRPSEVKEAALTKITVQMGVEGPYEKIRRLLYELEGMRRFLVIERLTLKDQKAASMLQVQLQLALYLR